MGGKRSKLKHAKSHHRPNHASGRSAVSKAGSKRPASSLVNRSLNRLPKRTAEDVSESDKQFGSSSRGAQTAKTAKQSQANFSITSSESVHSARKELDCLADDIGLQLDATSPERLLSSDQTLSTTAGKYALNVFEIQDFLDTQKLFSVTVQSSHTIVTLQCCRGECKSLSQATLPGQNPVPVPVP